MSRLPFIFSLSFCFGSAGAQTGPQDILFETEMARIKQARSDEELRFDELTANCYRRFAVNDCLREVRVRQRKTMEDLQRQEISINEQQRKRSGAEQLKRIDEKSSPEALRAEEKRRSEALQSHQERLQSQAQKKAELLKAEDERSRTVPETKAIAISPHTPEARAAERKAFEEKQRAAMEKQAKRELEAIEKKPSSARALPVPP
jgi:hypothetical protein